MSRKKRDIVTVFQPQDTHIFAASKNSRNQTTTKENGKEPASIQVRNGQLLVYLKHELTVGTWDAD
jgi:hypothetical protein